MYLQYLGDANENKLIIQYSLIWFFIRTNFTIEVLVKFLQSTNFKIYMQSLSSDDIA